MKGERSIVRRPIVAVKPEREGSRVNDLITAPKVLVIDSRGEQRGILEIEDARSIARQEGLDLVEVSPHADPPVCKLLDYGKFRYHEQKKANQARKRQKTVEVKEIKLRPNIDTHDYDVKMRNMRRFFGDGDKVKVTVRFRGRELAHQHLGSELLDRVCEEVSEVAKVEFHPRMEGRQMTMVLAPR